MYQQSDRRGKRGSCDKDAINGLHIEYECFNSQFDQGSRVWKYNGGYNYPIT